MTSEWPVVRLGDYCKKIGSGATPRGGKAVYVDFSETCLIRSQNVYNEGFTESGLAYIDEKAAHALRSVSVDENDVLLNITGDSVARVCMAPAKHLPARVNQHVSIIRTDENEFDPRFVRYFLASPQQQDALLAIAGAGATRNALTKSDIEAIEIPKPSLEMQRRIADHLKAIEDKNHLTQDINQTLDQMAQSVFKSWFVDFEPVKAKIRVLESGGDDEGATLAAMEAISGRNPQQLAVLYKDQPEQYAKLEETARMFPTAMQSSQLGEIPEGWSLTRLESLTDTITKGTTPKKADITNASDKPDKPFIKVKDISDSGVIDRNSLEKIPPSVHETVLKRSILKKDDLLFSIAGTIGRVAVVDEDLADSNTNQAVGIIRLNEPAIHLALVWLALKSKRVQDNIRSKVVQGVQANASLANLKDITVLIPSEELLHEANSFLSKMMSLVRQNQAESRNISEIRDALLPRLLSGEIPISLDDPGVEVLR